MTAIGFVYGTVAVDIASEEKYVFFGINPSDSFPSLSPSWEVNRYCNG
jgi:hypothetical protein